MSKAAASPVVLILGAGANIGAHVARSFAAKGYRVALTSRTSRAQETTDDGDLHLQGDLADPGSVAGIFAKVRDLLGLPSVVVYNGESALCINNNGAYTDPLYPGADLIRLSWCSCNGHSEPTTRSTLGLYPRPQP